MKNCFKDWSQSSQQSKYIHFLTDLCRLAPVVEINVISMNPYQAMSCHILSTTNMPDQMCYMPDQVCYSMTIAQTSDEMADVK